MYLYGVKIRELLSVGLGGLRIEKKESSSATWNLHEYEIKPEASLKVAVCMFYALLSTIF